MPSKRGASIQIRKNGAHYVYLVRFREYVNGSAVQRSRSFLTRSDAETFRERVTKDLALFHAGKHLFEDERIAAPIELAISEYRQHLEQQKRKADSPYPALCARILRQYTEQHHVSTTEQFTAQVVKAISERHRDQGHSCSRAQTVRLCKSFCLWASVRYRIDPEVLKVKTPAYKSKETPHWNDRMTSQILDELLRPLPESATVPAKRSSPEWRSKLREISAFHRRQCAIPWARVQLLWGARPKECALLQVQHWAAAERKLTIPAEVSKNGHARSFFIDKETARCIDLHVADRRSTDRLFVTPNGFRWSSDNQSRFMRGVLRKLGLPGYLYSSRHTAATRICRVARGNLPVIMSITGHRTLSQLQRYLHSTDDEQRGIADGLDF